MSVHKTTIGQIVWRLLHKIITCKTMVKHSGVCFTKHKNVSEVLMSCFPKQSFAKLVKYFDACFKEHVITCNRKWSNVLLSVSPNSHLQQSGQMFYCLFNRTVTCNRVAKRFTVCLNEVTCNRLPNVLLSVSQNSHLQQSGQTFYCLQQSGQTFYCLINRSQLQQGGQTFYCLFHRTVTCNRVVKRLLSVSPKSPATEWSNVLLSVSQNSHLQQSGQTFYCLFHRSHLQQSGQTFYCLFHITITCNRVVKRFTVCLTEESPATEWPNVLLSVSQNSHLQQSDQTFFVRFTEESPAKESSSFKVCFAKQSLVKHFVRSRWRCHRVRDTFTVCVAQRTNLLVPANDVRPGNFGTSPP